MVCVLLHSPSRLGADTPAVINSLEKWLGEADNPSDSPVDEEWAREGIGTDEAATAQSLIWSWFLEKSLPALRGEFESRRVSFGDLEMKYEYRVFGDRPEGGRRLFISMHGGGNAPSRVNDRQWQNQIGLYEPEEGVYVAPRAPTDTWNLWHQEHIDPMFARLILQMVAFEDVNPDRVYLMGYSAGGDGVYQLAPRMASWLAAASMMAGHPNETRPDGLRNLPFALYMGGKDAAYNRNQVAAEWKDMLGDLNKKDADGYVHKVVIFPDFGHWMQKQDAEALPWMSGFTRNTTPDRIVWLQDDVLHEAFYWLGVPKGKAVARSLTVASVSGPQKISIASEDQDVFLLFLSDNLVDLDKPVIVEINNSSAEYQVRRTVADLFRSLEYRKDRSYMVPVILEVSADSTQPAGAASDQP